MKKSNLIKSVIILLLGAMVMTFSTNVYAADNSFRDITNSYNTNTGNSNNTNTGNSNSNVNSNNTNTNNTNRNTNSNNTNVNNTNRNTNSNTNNTNAAGNLSIYNNLPQTGIEDSIPVALLVVVFGISAVYAYRKIKEYRNI